MDRPLPPLREPGALHSDIPEKHILRCSYEGKSVLLFSLSDTSKEILTREKKNTSDQETVVKIDDIVIMMGKIQINMSNHRRVYHGK